MLQPGPEVAHRVVTVCGGTDIGSARPTNQDTFVIVDLASGETSRPCAEKDVDVRRPGVLLVVCDGMGSRPAGHVAAHVAARAVKTELEQVGTAVVTEPALSLEHAVVGANYAVRREAQSHPEDRGMGTTCTAAVFGPHQLAVAQVGDSRAYLLRDGGLAHLTRDQTVPEKLVEAGILSEEDAEGHPYRHILLQALGSNEQVIPVITELALRQGDRVLVCSDGLHGAVRDDTIASILASTPGAGEATDALIAAALEAGGPDNVTVVVADCGPLRGAQGA